MRRIAIVGAFLSAGAAAIYVAFNNASDSVDTMRRALGVVSALTVRPVRSSPTVTEPDSDLQQAADSDDLDPLAAALRAARLPPAERRAALARIAESWVRHDARAALEAVARVADGELGSQLSAELLRAWANADPEAVIEYVLSHESAEHEGSLGTAALQAFVHLDARRATELAARIPGTFGQMLQRAALLGLARDDPHAALDHVQSLPPGADRDAALRAIARGYATFDPEGALAWAQSQDPPAPAVVANVLAELARRDPNRAVDMLLSMDLGSAQFSTLPNLFVQGLIEPQLAAATADRLAADPSSRHILRTITSVWAKRSPRDALDWLLANPQVAPRGALMAAAERLAADDPAAAVAYLDRVDADAAGDWLAATADGYAQGNPRRAAEWIADYRGYPGYESAVAAVALHLAKSDPIAAADLYESVEFDADHGDMRTTAAHVALHWFARDRAAAADWATSVATPEARARAVEAIAQRWSDTDPAAAREWVLRLPPGAARDAALVPVLGALVAEAGEPEPALLNAFSSAAARQRAVVDTVLLLRSSDRGAARRLADRHLTDAELRAYAVLFVGDLRETR